jgi:hypothetical protein
LHHFLGFNSTFELGLAKNGRSTPFSMFLPERLVCIDFEATCEKDDKNYYNEIIEFPSILIDTKKKTVISGSFSLQFWSGFGGLH